MSNPYQLVVFDWEGTIADTVGCILHTVSSEAHKLGYGAIDPYEARKYIDLGLAQSLKKLVPDLSLIEYDELLHAVQRAVVSRSTAVCLIPGARQFIQYLHDAQVHIAIATNRGHHSLMRALQATELDQLFKITRSAGQVPSKPCPQMLEEIMDEFGVQSHLTLMIGDSPVDMEMAKSINVPAIGVDFYHQQNTSLITAGAQAVFDDYQLLADFLKLPMSK